MKTLCRITQNYLILGIPFVIFVMVWSSLLPGKDGVLPAPSGALAKFFWELFSWNLMVWFSVLICFFVFLIISPEARHQTLKRVANIKERDEREEYITGQASKASYISTLSVLILLLFLSVFTFQIRQIPENQRIDGKSKVVSIGLRFQLFNQPNIEQIENGKVLFESQDIPLSKTGILLAVLLWQLMSFNLNARKRMLEY